MRTRLAIAAFAVTAMAVAGCGSTSSPAPTTSATSTNEADAPLCTSSLASAADAQEGVKDLKGAEVVDARMCGEHVAVIYKQGDKLWLVVVVKDLVDPLKVGIRFSACNANGSPAYLPLQEKEEVLEGFRGFRSKRWPAYTKGVAVYAEITTNGRKGSFFFDKAKTRLYGAC